MPQPATEKPPAPPATVSHHHQRPPGPRNRFFIGGAREIQRDPLRFLLELTSQYGDLVYMRLLFLPIYFVNHPDYIKHVLQENHRNYNKDVVDYRLLRMFLRKGLLTNDGESWLHQRRLIQPAFHRQRLTTFGTLMTNATLAMLERWEREASHSEQLDVAAEMMRLTQQIVGQALFTIDLSAEADTIGQALTTLNNLIIDYFYTPFPPLGVPTPRNRRLRNAGRTLDRIVESVIQARRQQQADTGDLLSMLLVARDEETGQGMDDRQVRDEVLTLLLAGHETTSNALSWTWYLLSQHPEIEQRLHTELEQVLGGRVPTVEDLSALHYTRMVIEESMRLYPPAWSFTRNALADDEIGGYHIPAGSIVMLCPYTTHRHPTFWQNPEVFDPERFAPERSASRPRYAYFPFGGGPRLCIGNNFAMMETQLILATVAQRYRLRLVPGARVEPAPLITLRPRSGLPMVLQAV